MTTIEQARARLVLSQPWLAALIYRLQERADSSIPTAATDGRHILYSPAWFGGLTVDEGAMVVAHEALHCAFHHIGRCAGRDKMLWNIAADYAVNIILSDAGMPLINGALISDKYRGWTTEKIYADLPKDYKALPFPDIIDSDDPALAEEWRAAAAEAFAAGIRCGKLPDGADRLFSDAIASKIDWRKELSYFLQRCSGRDDYSYRVPSRRGRSIGLVLPGTFAEKCGPIAICIDTSGSMDKEMLGKVVAETRMIAQELQAESVVVIEADAAVAKITELDQFDDWAQTTLKGGGGTDFRPAIAEAETRDVCAIIYLTDLDGVFPVAENKPIFWGTCSLKKAPLGRTILLE